MRLTSVAAIGVMTAAAVGCGDSGTDYGNGGGTGSGNSVTVVNNAFNPGTLNLSGGTTVTWTWNSGGVLHNVTFEDGTENSANQGSGTHQRTFGAPGPYRYRCTNHSTSFTAGMVGSIVVP